MNPEYYYIGLLKNGNAIMFNNLSDVESIGIVSYFHPEFIPDGDGVLRTDGISKIWFEDPPVNNSIPIIIEDPKPDQMMLLKAQVNALSQQNEFLEDCIAEMASEVYK